MNIKLRYLLLILLLPTVICSAAQEEYKMEIGGGAGGCFYLGDANSKPFAHMSGMGAVVARYLINHRMAIKGNLAFGQIRGNTGTLFFPENPNSENAQGGISGTASFKRNLIDFGAQFELNFWSYGIGSGYEGYSRITPYILLGAGVTIATKPVTTNGGLYLPFGLGVKYKIRPRLNVGLEWSIRFTTTDDLDVSNTNGVKLSAPFGIPSSGFKNKDCYSFTMLTITYDILPKCINCNNIKYVY